jgi:hypothetical protein
MAIPAERDGLKKNTLQIETPWQMKYGDNDTNHITIHKKCADSLKRVLEATWDAVDHSQAKIKKLHFDLYSGSYVLRPMRSGRSISMHSFACAIDWADRFNPYQAQKHEFTKDTILIANFILEGWVWGGSWTSPVDSMHIQAARVR